MREPITCSPEDSRGSGSRHLLGVFEQEQGLSLCLWGDPQKGSELWLTFNRILGKNKLDAGGRVGKGRRDEGSNGGGNKPNIFKSRVVRIY